MSVERNFIAPVRVADRPKRRLRFAERDSLFWRRAWGGLWAAGAFLASASAMGTPTGFGASQDVMLMVLAATAAMGLFSMLLAIVFTWLRLPLPRLFAGGAATLLSGSIAALKVSGAGWTGSVVIAAAYTACGMAAGMLLSALHAVSVRRCDDGAGTPAAFKAAAISAALLLLLPAAVRMSEDIGEAMAGEAADYALAQPPSGQGGYQAFTYGSGSDRREEFAEDAMLVSRTADASSLLPSWSPLKSLYWGFEPARLPLNGTAWLPDGEEPVPLVLLVHGNHLAEQDSDKGYAYLGEMLASRGYAAVSVDENFLNYSVWSDIPEDDMLLRSWLLLRHLEQLAEWAEQPDNPFYGRIDLSRTALIGHSRGGQAAAMAADASRWFGTGVDGVSIRAVAALAPTDTITDGERAQLSGVSYLVLQGGRDADLTDFYGERQYNRTAIEPDSDAFKAAVYIPEANHSRFNSDWGTMDNSLPGGLLLSQKGLLSGEEQRAAASYFISAFMDAVFRSDAEARDRIRNPGDSLPGFRSPGYSIQYEDGSYRMLQDFEKAGDLPSLPAAEAAPGLSAAVEPVPSRSGGGQDSLAGVFSWAAGSGEDYYRIRLEEPPVIQPAGGITFSAANRSMDLCDADGSACQPQEITATVRLTDADGQFSQAAVGPISPPEAPRYLRMSWLAEGWSKGKYKAAAASVLHSYRMPLKLFAMLNPSLDTDGLVSVEIRFRSAGSGPGKLMLDNIGLYGPDFSKSSISPPG
ncbi:hypothetical protein [Paenibacillus sp. D9]|uniref:hypothetical protein n=1 Tax=Paenibacillus sp. D9 TaxID=665792 RepID=UPI000A52C9E3|nr:hypothetical protein [Paenibacillus sp. D9]